VPLTAIHKRATMLRVAGKHNLVVFERAKRIP
jgi:hypothetical protein